MDKYNNLRRGTERLIEDNFTAFVIFMGPLPCLTQFVAICSTKPLSFCKSPFCAAILYTIYRGGVLIPGLLSKISLLYGWILPFAANCLGPLKSKYNKNVFIK